MFGVRGRLWEPSFFVGVPGTGASVDFGLKNDEAVFVRDSTDRGALYFLCVEFSKIGVLTRERRAASWSAELELVVDTDAVDPVD